jgi:DNA gyrase subunit A
LSDFTNVKSNGKIAMKLPDGTTLVGAKVCSDQNDVMLTTSMGKAIRFPVTDVRVFKGRDSIGVRGIKLAAKDFVVSMAIISHVDASSEERQAYFKMRKSALEEADGEQTNQNDLNISISDERFSVLSSQEEWLLTITSAGFGKRSSAHEYRVSNRGGQGITAANLGRRDDTIISSFPVENDDQIMLVTSTGQSIRCPVEGISRQSRTASGVTVFNTADKEKVVSVALIAEKNEPEIDDPN